MRQSRALLLLSIPLLLVAGCASDEQNVVEVRVPVSVPCIPSDFPGGPAYVDTDADLLAAGGPEERYRLLVIGREQRSARLGTLEGVVNACRRPE